MRIFATVSLISACLASTGFVHSQSAATSVQRLLVPKGSHDQTPLAMSGHDGHNSDPVRSGDPIITDVLGRERKINVFAGLIRDVDSVSKRLHDDSSNTTILAPLNTELLELPKKPWEDPEDYRAFGTNAYEGPDGESRAERNLRNFVEGHIVPQSPWKPGTKVSTLAGTSLQLEEKDGKRIIQPGNVEVDAVADTVANGQIWVIRGVLGRR